MDFPEAALEIHAGIEASLSLGSRDGPAVPRDEENGVYVFPDRPDSPERLADLQAKKRANRLRDSP